MNITTNAKLAGIIAAGTGKTMNVLGHTATIKLGSDITGGEYYCFELLSPPGAGVPPHVHDKEDEVIFIVEGTFAVTVGAETLTAGPGSTLHFARHTPHGFANVGTTTGRTLWTVMPGDNFEPFFDKLGALPAGEPDLANLAKIFGEHDIAIVRA